MCEGLMIDSTNEIELNHLRGCVKAFLSGKQQISWIMAFVRGHHPSKELLLSIINEYKQQPFIEEYNELCDACRKENLL